MSDKQSGGKTTKADQKVARSAETKVTAGEISNELKVLPLAKAILSHTSDAVIVADTNNNIVLFNNSAQQIFGDPNQKLDSCVEKYKLFLPDKVTPVPPGGLPIERALRGEEIESATVFQAITGSSDGRWLNADAFPVKNDRGEIIAGVVVCRDQTAEILLEQERLDKIAQQQLQKMAEAIPQLVWISEADGEMTYFNQRWTTVTGLTLEQSRGHGWVTALYEEDFERALNYWNKQRESGADVEIECRIKTKDGVRWFLVRAVAVKDEHGKVMSWFGTNTDIDDQKRSAERLERLVSELQERTLELQASRDEIEQLAHVVSHEMQPHLREMTSELSLLSARYKERLGEDADRFITHALAGGKNVERMLDGLWIYARIQKVATGRIKCSLNDILEKSSARLQDIIDEKDASLTLDKLPDLSVNPQQMEFIFQQLIENSLRFSAGAPSIRVTATKRHTDWIISVQDRGIGFDMMDNERVFAMFCKLNKQTSGTGMGLAICRRIIEAHGGRMWAKSSPGEGTTIYFTVRD